MYHIFWQNNQVTLVTKHTEISLNIVCKINGEHSWFDLVNLTDLTDVFIAKIQNLGAVGRPEKPFLKKLHNFKIKTDLSESIFDWCFWPARGKRYVFLLKKNCDAKLTEKIDIFLSFRIRMADKKPNEKSSILGNDPSLEKSRNRKSCIIAVFVVILIAAVVAVVVVLYLRFHPSSPWAAGQIIFFVS